MAKLLTATGALTTVTPKDGKRFTLQELQAHVGGYIQILDRTVPATGPEFADINVLVSPGTGKARVRMVMDEEGKLKTGARVNPRATAILASALMPHDQIVGDVLIMEVGDKL